jgi:hypothetical protein
VAAAWPFFGQYVAHDLTADRSPLRAHADVLALRNMLSPRANLESLYGGGPEGAGHGVPIPTLIRPNTACLGST